MPNPAGEIFVTWAVIVESLEGVAVSAGSSEPQDNRRPLTRNTRAWEPDPRAHRASTLPKHVRYQAALRPDGRAKS